MAVTILSLPKQSCLQVSGDVQAMLMIPAQPPVPTGDGEMFVDTYYISLSDGSLIQASYQDEPEFDVVVEGAGRVKLGPEGKSLFVDWKIEWVNLASNRAATALAHKVPASLPLFDRLAL